MRKLVQVKETQDQRLYPREKMIPGNEIKNNQNLHVNWTSYTLPCSSYMLGNHVLKAISLIDPIFHFLDLNTRSQSAYTKDVLRKVVKYKTNLRI